MIARDAREGRHVRAAATVGAVGFLFASTASAHSGTGLAGGFPSGFSHPLAGVDHLLAMVLVGVWGAVLGRPLIALLPVIFPLVMVVGAVAGMVGVPLPPVEIGVAASVIALGGCVAFAFRAPVGLACTIIAIFAIFHGYAHGRELPSAADPIGYSAGFVIATGLLHIAGIGIGCLDRWRAGVVVTRAAGGVASVFGFWLLVAAIAA